MATCTKEWQDSHTQFVVFIRVTILKANTNMGESMKEVGAVIEDARSAVFKKSESLEGSCAKIHGYDFNHGIDYSKLLKSMVSTGFQASNFGDAIDTVNQMVLNPGVNVKTRV